MNNKMILAGFVCKVFVPKASSQMHSHIIKGSAVVGMESHGGRVLIYFEGNMYGAENVKTFEEKCTVAAGRLALSAPTIAKCLVDVSEVIEVGEFDWDNKSFTANGCHEDLAEWLK